MRNNRITAAMATLTEAARRLRYELEPLNESDLLDLAGEHAVSASLEGVHAPAVTAALMEANAVEAESIYQAISAVLAAVTD